jgi:hypothetical protein
MCGIGPWSDFCNDDEMATSSGRTQLRYNSLSSQPRRNADGRPAARSLQVDDAAVPQLTDPPVIVIAVMNDGIKLRFDGAKFWPRGVAPMRSPLSK